MRTAFADAYCTRPHSPSARQPDFDIIAGADRRGLLLVPCK
jgi:hypothetical protein